MTIKEVAINKKARFDYFIEETVEAGISLTGAEVKSAKMSHINVADSFCFIEKGSIMLKNCHITPYEKGSYYNVESRRDRQLLLHKKEIARLIGKIREKGYTLVPIRAYFKGRYLKIELGLCKGKHTYDKKQVIKERDLDRQAQRDIANYR
ncbi:MAG: SsrA-binding protein SmpB [Clostridia bacterium]|nr:SsrA-binding protein SmpB [Clostridia bacterium]MBQ7224347.1 SsrA-binding protein SmpB [Clostridia bacterium]MBR7141423.1 SsrA-binding protein SmpB [Clostridia bacterium]